MPLKPKILMFAPIFIPMGNPEAIVNANLVSAMLQAGWDVDIVTCPEKKRWHAESLHWYPESARQWKDVHDHIYNVDFLPATVSNRLLSIIGLFLMCRQTAGGGRWAIPAARVAGRLASLNGYDVIISRCLPPEAHLAAFITASKTGIPWIANWNDPPSCMAPKPYWRGKEGRMGIRERKFYRAMAKQASWHTFPCERLRSYICGYLPDGVIDRSSVIPHLAPGPYPQKRMKGPKFTLLYAGSLYPPRDPGNFLRGVRIFLDRAGADISVRFVTNKPDMIKAVINEFALERFACAGPAIPHEELPFVLAEAEVLVIIEPDMEEGIFLPSKLADYVRTGRPVLAVSPKTGTLSDILAKHGGGLAVDCSRPEAIAKGIAVLYESWLEGSIEERFSSGRLIKMYDKDAVLGGYMGIFYKLGIK